METDPPTRFNERSTAADQPHAHRTPFFSPSAETEKHRRQLPHWHQASVWCFATWRLQDSVPSTKLTEWRTEKAHWLTHHPEPWDAETEAAFHAQFSQQIDDWLDQGVGACVLRDPQNAEIVHQALRHFDGVRYEVAAFVVMPNHVHALFRPLDSHRISSILKSWKGFTARQINQRLGKQGALWQEEYWDRLIRSEAHFWKVIEYIRHNPVKANLKSGFLLWEA